MLLLDRQSVAAAPRRGGANHVQLRLRADGRLLELPLGKTTIGSSPRCNVRIQQPGVEPVHCLIVHGPEGLSVRRWAADTQLNGAPFDDAPLAEGDRLMLGGVELELVPSPSTAVQPAERAPSSTATSDELLDTMQESVAAMACLEAAPMAADSAIVEQVVEREPELADTVEIDPSAAAEVVFRELQAACATSRGRGRKLLAALRNKQNEYNELLHRYSDADQQLVELNRQRAEWEQGRDGRASEQRDWASQLQDLRRQMGDWEDRLADQTQRMSELQRDLAAAMSPDAPVAQHADRAAVVAYSDVVSRKVETLTSGPKDVEPLSVALTIEPDDTSAVLPPKPSNEHIKASTTTAKEPTRRVELPAPARELPVSDWSSSLDESTGDWSGPALGEAWSAAGGEKRTNGADADHWNSAPHDESPEDDIFGAGSTHAKQSAWPGEPTTHSSDVAAAETADDVNPFAEFSNWKQGAGSQQPSHERPAKSVPKNTAERAPLWGSETFEKKSTDSAPGASLGAVAPAAAGPNPWAVPAEVPAGDVAEAAPKKAQPTSFIERYSHMFADEAAEETTTAAVPAQPVAVAATSLKPRTMGIVRNEGSQPTSTASDDEESIEQYMAKLLQRVRGDGPARVASQAAPSPPAEQEVVAAVKSMSLQQPAPASDEMPQSAEREPMTEDEATEELASWDVSKRKALMPAFTTDMGALRALANATARGAISRHELVKHRREAVTKVIVSTLAGMTSVWLMLLAPNWRNIQFIIACASLIVAAYWAGEAFRALLETMRAAVYDGPEEYLNDSESTYRPALPIDVEDRF